MSPVHPFQRDIQSRVHRRLTRDEKVLVVKQYFKRRWERLSWWQKVLEKIGNAPYYVYMNVYVRYQYPELWNEYELLLQ